LGVGTGIRPTWSCVVSVERGRGKEGRRRIVGWRAVPDADARNGAEAMSEYENRTNLLQLELEALRSELATERRERTGRDGSGGLDAGGAKVGVLEKDLEDLATAFVNREQQLLEELERRDNVSSMLEEQLSELAGVLVARETELLDAVRAKEKECIALQETVEVIDRDRDCLEASLTELAAQFVGLESELASQKHRSSEEDERRETSRVAIEEMESELVNARRELQQVEREKDVAMAEARKRIDALKAALAQSDMQLQELALAYAELEQTEMPPTPAAPQPPTPSLREEEQADKLRQQAIRVAMLQDQVRTMSKAIEGAHEATRVAVYRFTDEVQDLRKEVRDTNEKLLATQKELFHAQAEVDSLAAALAAKDKEMRSLAAEYTTEKAKWNRRSSIRLAASLKEREELESKVTTAVAVNAPAPPPWIEPPVVMEKEEQVERAPNHTVDKQVGQEPPDESREVLKRNKTTGDDVKAELSKWHWTLELINYCDL